MQPTWRGAKGSLPRSFHTYQLHQYVPTISPHSRPTQLSATLTSAEPVSAAAVVSSATSYLTEHKDLKAMAGPKQLKSDMGDRVGLVSQAELREGQVSLSRDAIVD